MTAGQYNYPFSFDLPQIIPSSFEHRNGSVRYSIKAIMKRPWKFEKKTKILFIVELPLDLYANAHLLVRK